MQKSRVQQEAHHDGDTADSIQIKHQVLAEGLEIREERRTVADALEVIEIQFEASLVSNSRKVEHRVRRPAESHDDRDRILQGLTRDDVSRRDSLANHLHDRPTRISRLDLAPRVHRRGRR